MPLRCKRLRRTTGSRAGLIAQPLLTIVSAAAVAALMSTSGTARAGEGESVVGEFPADAINAEVTEWGRPVHQGKSYGESVKAASTEAAEAKSEIRSTVGGEEERYAEWLRLSAEERGKTLLATLKLTEFESRLEVACEKFTPAGESMKLYVLSTGGADARWNVCLLHPESSEAKWDACAPYDTGGLRYDCRELIAGKRVLGGKPRIDVIEFDTYPADRGKLLGVLVEYAAYTAHSHTFWVKVR